MNANSQLDEERRDAMKVAGLLIATAAGLYALKLAGFRFVVGN